jgi:hypothetical protein
MFACVVSLNEEAVNNYHVVCFKPEHILKLNYDYQICPNALQFH